MSSTLLLAPVQGRPAPRPTLQLSRKHARPRAVAVAPAQALTVPQNLACGAFARVIQILAMFPIDTIKVRIQVSRVAKGASTAAATPLSAIRSAIGKGSLYNGAAFSLIGQVPYGMLTFGLYETLRSELFQKRLPAVPDWLQIVLSASVGDAVGSLWLTPSEVVKSKTQAGLFKSPVAAASAIARSGVGGFYQGYGAAVARDIPFRALQFTLYEAARSWYAARLAKRGRGDMSAVENLALGAVAGVITAAATTPLDVIRTRMMTQGSGSMTMYKSSWECLTKTVANEGAAALLKGITPRCFLIGPSSAIFFLAYEAAKSFFRRRVVSKRVARLPRPVRGTRLARSPGCMLLSSRRPVIC